MKLLSQCRPLTRGHARHCGPMQKFDVGNCCRKIKVEAQEEVAVRISRIKTNALAETNLPVSAA